MRSGHAWADSREVAKSFGKEHRNVLRDVDAILVQRPDLGGVYFQEVSSPHPTVANTLIRHFEMTRDGFSLLAMGWTGAKALAFKVAYIDRFNAMETALKQILCTSWRTAGILPPPTTANSLMRKLPERGGR